MTNSNIQLAAHFRNRGFAAETTLTGVYVYLRNRTISTMEVRRAVESGYTFRRFRDGVLVTS